MNDNRSEIHFLITFPIIHVVPDCQFVFVSLSTVTLWTLAKVKGDTTGRLHPLQSSISVNQHKWCKTNKAVNKYLI